MFRTGTRVCHNRTRGWYGTVVGNVEGDRNYVCVRWDTGGSTVVSVYHLNAA